MSSCSEPFRMPLAPPRSPVHGIAKLYIEITVTRVIEITSAITLKCNARTIPSLEKRVQGLLGTTDNPDTIRHICQFFPFRDQNIPQAVLSGRWDYRLDSFLIAFHGNLGVEQELLQLSREQKVGKLLRLLDPLPEKQSNMWTWAPPDLSGKPDDIAEAIQKVISAAFFQITLREWLVYLDGNEVTAINRLLLGFRCISTYVNQLVLEKYKLVKKVLYSGDFLGYCVFGHDCPEQILLGFFLNPMEKALKCRSPSLTMERLALLNQRYIAIGAGRNWYNFWTDLDDLKAPRGINHRRPEPAGWRVPRV